VPLLHVPLAYFRALRFGQSIHDEDKNTVKYEGLPFQPHLISAQVYLNGPIAPPMPPGIQGDYVGFCDD
jgi:hypothetical protein